MTGQNESRPERVAGIPAGPDYLAQSIAREKMAHLTDATSQPSDSTEMPEIDDLIFAGAQLANCASNLSQGGAKLDERTCKVLHECSGKWDASAVAFRDYLRSLLADRERLIRDRDEAVAFEREACAKEVERFLRRTFTSAGEPELIRIAQAIRSRTAKDGAIDKHV